MKSNKSKSEYLNGTVYTITLIIFIVIGLGIYFLYLSNDLFRMIGTIIVAATIHFIIYFWGALYINLGEEGPFVKQYNKLMENYEQNDNPQMLYEGLINIKYSPVKKETKNAYNLSMSTALHRINRTKEALTYLDEIETDNHNLKNIVEAQKKHFKGISTNK